MKTEREKFEEWAKSYILQPVDGLYTKRCLFDAWQARAALGKPVEKNQDAQIRDRLRWCLSKGSEPVEQAPSAVDLYLSGEPTHNKPPVMMAIKELDARLKKGGL